MNLVIPFQALCGLRAVKGANGKTVCGGLLLVLMFERRSLSFGGTVHRDFSSALLTFFWLPTSTFVVAPSFLLFFFLLFFFSSFLLFFFFFFSSFFFLLSSFFFILPSFLLSSFIHCLNHQIGVLFGEEPFYISVFPFLAWNIDIGLCRRIVIIWSLTMVFGQALKDHYKV